MWLVLRTKDFCVALLGLNSGYQSSFSFVKTFYSALTFRLVNIQ